LLVSSLDIWYFGHRIGFLTARFCDNRPGSLSEGRLIGCSVRLSAQPVAAVRGWFLIKNDSISDAHRGLAKR
jgi:hypothetical protein